MQGDDFAAALAEGAALRGDKLATLRLSGCNVSDEGTCRLAKALEAIGAPPWPACGALWLCAARGHVCLAQDHVLCLRPTGRLNAVAGRQRLVEAAAGCCLRHISRPTCHVARRVCSPLLTPPPHPIVRPPPQA